MNTTDKHHMDTPISTHPCGQTPLRDAESLLREHGVKATSNRILVARTLLGSSSPLSLSDLERLLDTLDKSSIFRALTVLKEHHVVHDVEDGRGLSRYEICDGHEECTPDDMHVHFYCEQCGNVVCFPTIPSPKVDVPPGYEVRTVNYMLKGLCPRCAATKK